MNKGDKVRLNHELLLWCGFTLTNGVWSYPDGITVDDGVPFFPEDEIACFKWLVPKLGLVDMEIDLTSTADKRCDVILEIFNDPHYVWEEKHTYYNASAPSVALALCLSIQKLIRSK